MTADDLLMGEASFPDAENLAIEDDVLWALGEVYHGAEKPEARAFIDKLLDRGRRIL